MRRYLYSLAALAGLLCGLTGCWHTAGVCDCDLEEDPCCARAPWYKMSDVQHPGSHAEPPQRLPNKL